MKETKFIDVLETIRKGEELRIINTGNKYEIFKNSVCIGTYNVSDLLEKNKENYTLGLDWIIYDLLKEIGIPTHLLGYNYIAKAIGLCLEDKESMKYRYIAKEIYPTVANCYKTTPSRVERAIRKAIDVCLTKGNVEFKNMIFGDTSISSKNHLTNSEFIFGIAEYLYRKSLS